MTAGRLASRANAMPAENRRLKAQGHSQGREVTGDRERKEGEQQAKPTWGTDALTLWDLDASTTESAQQVGDEVVFDLVLREPGEHGEQPKHHGFDLGRGTSGGEEGRLPVGTA